MPLNNPTQDEVTEVERVASGPAAPVRLYWHAQPGWYWRLRGLLGRPQPLPGHAWWLHPCRAVHTLGMAYAIDLVFVSRDCTVLRVCDSVPPARLAICWRAASVAELAAGECRRLGIVPGSRLEVPASQH